VERPGRAVQGSTRAELQHWAVNLDEKSATIVETRQRQLTPAARRVERDEMRAVAERLADLIATNHEDDAIEWRPDGSVHVVIARLIPGLGPKRTVEGRRKRLKEALEMVLSRNGWVAEGTNVFRRETKSPVSQEN
jgi:hypothetical protein